MDKTQLSRSYLERIFRRSPRSHLTDRIPTSDWGVECHRPFVSGTGSFFIGSRVKGDTLLVQDGSVSIHTNLSQNSDSHSFR